MRPPPRGIEIQLTQGYVALVSRRDAGHVRSYSWHIRQARDGRPYAQRNLKLDGGRTHTTQTLHLFVLGILGIRPPGLVADHIDGNRLDCRRHNLRWISKSGNSRNRKIMAGKRGPTFLGVIKNENSPSWRACSAIPRSGKAQYLGSYNTAREAALAYDRYVEKLPGGRLNFPGDTTTPVPLTKQRQKRRHNATGYRGVQATPLGRYKACVSKGNGVPGSDHVGVFDTAEDAARAYDAAAIAKYGDAAILNFPKG